MEENKKQPYLQLLDLLKEYSGIDFVSYKENSVMRRVDKRIRYLKYHSLEAYLLYIKENEEERDALIQEILINVTEFFRDVQAYESLYRNLFPLIIKENTQVRVWCAACSTGEEAYSIAVMLQEYLERNLIKADFRLFATDVSGEAIRTASSGQYSRRIEQMLTDILLEKYFENNEKGYKIKDFLREKLVFVRHNILRDTPFAKLDLIVCRNFLIYITPEKQKEIISLFRSILNPGGGLFLGNSESAGEFKNIYRSIDKKNKLYVRRETSAADNPGHPVLLGFGRDSMLSEWFSCNNLQEKAEVECLGDSVGKGKNAAYAMGAADGSITVPENEKTEVHRLEAAIAEKDRLLQKVFGELEIRKEKIQSTYEEIVVANEELQSSNEELQSMNEELASVNTMHHEKIEELMQMKNDLDNLLTGGEIGALYIDGDMTIRKITPIIENVSNLKSADVGRPITHILFMDKYPEFLHDIKQVMGDGGIIEREVLDSDGTNWLFRIRPYRVDQGSAGVLITVFDITKRLEAARFELQTLTDNVPGGVVKIRFEEKSLILLYANSGFFLLSGYTFEEYKKLYEINYLDVINKEDWPALKRAIERAVEKKGGFVAVYRVFPEKGEFYREIRGVVQEEAGEIILQCIIYDITESEMIKSQLVMANKKYAALLDNMDGGILHIRYEMGIGGESLLYVSDGFLRLIDYTKEEYDEIRRRGCRLPSAYKDDVKIIIKNMEDHLKGRAERFIYYRMRKKNGGIIWVQATGSAIERNEEEAVFQYIISDITMLKETQKELEREKEQVEAIASLSANILFRYDIDNEVATSILKNGVYFPERVKENYEEFIFDSDLVYKDDIEVFKHFFDDFRTKAGENHAEFRRKFEDGSYRWIYAETTTLSDEDGCPYLVVGKYTDVQEQKLQQLKLLEESSIDSLTGLYQRNYFKEKTDSYIQTMKNREKAAFLLIDIDDFKDINDNYGHLFGDTVLQNVAEGIKAIKEFHLTAGRFGGDEFMVLVQNVSEEADILRVSAQINNILKIKYHGNKITNAITFSMGIVMIPEEGTGFQELFSKADFTLYKTKQMGKNRSMFFHSFEKEYVRLDEFDGRFKSYEEVYESTRLNLSEELVEYLISILGGIDDFNSAVSIIITYIGNKFDLSYISLRQIDRENCRFVLDQQWRKSDKYPNLRKLHQYSKQGFKNFLLRFDDEGVYLCEDCTENSIEDYVDTWGAQVGVKATMQCLIRDNDQAVGVITFAYTEHGRIWTAREIKMLKIITKVLSLHISSNKNLHEIEEKVEQMSLYDKITGLYNYNRFKEEANRILAANSGMDRLAVVYSDFTNFKHINDAYGYEVGDKILKEFAAYVVTNNPKAIIGAREYADNIVSLVHVTNRNTLEEYVNIYNNNFAEKQNAKYPGLNMIVSTGGYIIGEEEKDIVAAIDNANIARKIIKERRRGGFLYFEPQMLTTINKQAKILADFSDAVRNREFKMYLQPQIDIQTGEAIGAEALVRWQKADGSFVYPDEFIPILERNGSIVELDFYMLECALQTLREWEQSGSKMIPLSVNFSRVHFYNDNLVGRLLAEINKYGIDPCYIDIEITEGMFMENYGRLAEDINLIRSEGFSISIDDFGTGYSSLSVLTNLEVQAIKIDKSFLYGAEKSDAQRNIIEYMFALAKELGLGVVCEGAETENQIKFLMKAGCRVVQGYYFDRPLPLEEFCRKYISPV